VYFAACFAVAHSPSAGASVQDLDVGAMAMSWDSVRALSRVKRENGIGVAVVWMVRVRVRERRRVWRCILLSCVDGVDIGKMGDGLMRNYIT